MTSPCDYLMRYLRVRNSEVSLYALQKYILYSRRPHRKNIIFSKFSFPQFCFLVDSPFAFCCCCGLRRWRLIQVSFQPDTKPSNFFWQFFFSLDASSHLYMRVCPSVCPCVGPSVPCYFRRWKERILGASCAVYPALLFSLLSWVLSFVVCFLFSW